MGGRQALAPRWRSALAGVAELLWPRACVACGGAMEASDRGQACGRCWSRLPVLPKPWCPRCGHPDALGKPETGNGELNTRCSLCDQLHPGVTHARSVCWVPHLHSSPLLAALKYQGWWGIADAMAERMVRTGRDVLEGHRAPVFVPVPLAAARLRERGYNQSERLARALARRTGGRVLDAALQRTRDTVSQTQLTLGERVVNVHQAFAVPVEWRAAIRGRFLVLVDDVLTTGATLNACADALLQGGASHISYWTFGRARTNADRP